MVYGSSSARISASCPGPITGFAAASPQQTSSAQSRPATPDACFADAIHRRIQRSPRRVSTPPRYNRLQASGRSGARRAFNLPCRSAVPSFDREVYGMEEMTMQLYEFAPTRSIRARWTLQELGVEFESIPVNLAAREHQRPEFLAINPAGKVPVLVDDDLVLTESVAIVLYL